MPQDFIPAPGHFSEGLTPIGDRSVSVAIGPISIRFSGIPEHLEGAIRDRYSPFLWEGEVLNEATLHAGAPAYLGPALDGILRCEEETHPEGRILISEGMAAFRPHAGTTGMIRVSLPGDMKHLNGAMENYLRWTMADLVLQHGGFLLHAAGVVRDGQAFIFFGHSGAGKSTLCSLSEGSPILSDDMIMVLRDGAGFRSTTTPFVGVLSQRLKERESFPVGGLFRIIQSPDVRVANLPRGLAVGMVLSCCPFISDASKRSQVLLPLVEELCTSVPVRELYFRKDPSFWGVVDEARRSHGR
jgi:hypothetical protein